MNVFRVKRHMLGIGPRPSYKLTRFVPNEVLANEGYNGETFHKIVIAWERAVPWYVKQTGDATMTIIPSPDNLGMTLIVEIPSRG